MSDLLTHQALHEVQLRVYDVLGFHHSQPIAEESAEYGACDFALNDFTIKFRVAKITPTKIGQFVTLWKRSNKGPIQPFDNTDSMDFVVINTRKDEHFGQFIFPKAALCQHGIVSMNHLGGKRAIRVYPPWDIAVNPQAKKTQQWQLAYFLEIPENTEIDVARARVLYGQLHENAQF